MKHLHSVLPFLTAANNSLISIIFSSVILSIKLTEMGENRACVSKLSFLHYLLIFHYTHSSILLDTSSGGGGDGSESEESK